MALALLALVSAGVVRDLEIRVRLALRRVYFAGSADSLRELQRELVRSPEARLVGAVGVRAPVSSEALDGGDQRLARDRAGAGSRGRPRAHDRGGGGRAQRPQAACARPAELLRVRVQEGAAYRAHARVVPVRAARPAPPRALHGSPAGHGHGRRRRPAARLAAADGGADAGDPADEPGTGGLPPGPGRQVGRAVHARQAAHDDRLRRQRRMGDSTTSTASRRSAGCCAATAWTSFPSSGTCCAASSPWLDRGRSRCRSSSASSSRSRSTRRATRCGPGITGWAQVNLGYSGSLEGARAKLQRDLYYVKHRSLRLDLLILWLTLKAVFTDPALMQRASRTGRTAR